jgi:5-methyltetrahydrofolate corrinoid/iron sulfur protein methyltransferase
MSQTTMTQATKTKRPFKLIGELMNNSFARAARAFQARDVTKFQGLASLQSELGADFLTLNIDGTQRMMVKMNEMLEFLPTLIPAIQEVTDTPISFDNPATEFHEVALKHYKRTENNQPIFNSVAASRHDLDGMIDLIAKYDTKVIVMASEKFVDGGGAQCTTAQEVYEATKHHVKILRDKAGRKNADLIVDPGLAPISADTYGLVNMGLDSIELIRKDPDLEGIHISVGLTNFSFGLPKDIREGVENAYITLAHAKGLDYILGNPEKELSLLDEDSRYMKIVQKSLAAGRPADGESQEDAGFQQAEVIMELFSEDDL